MMVAMISESMFGNTEALAGAVADGLRDRGAEVAMLHAGDPGAHDLRDVDLLVIAAPTHALSLPRPRSRADAVAQGADPARAGVGVREWLATALGDAANRPCPPTVVFDTKMKIARHWPGSAARTTARALRRRGFDVPLHTSFYVGGMKGPVLPGELERARAWGRTVASRARRPTAPRA